MLYLTWKALHIIFMVCWFAMLFYLPRLYVYHALALAEADQASCARLAVMEKKLYRLGHIAMGLTLIFGFLLLHAGDYAWLKGQGWLHAKLVLIALLVAYHLYCGHINRTLRSSIPRKTHNFYRFFNEIPAILLIAIVLLASLKPF